MDRETAMASELLDIAKATVRQTRFSPEAKFFIKNGKFYEIDSAVYPRYVSLPEELLRHAKAEKRYSLKVVTAMVQICILDLQASLSIDNARSKIDACLRTLSRVWPDQAVLHHLHGVTFVGMTRPLNIAGARVARFTSTDRARLMRINKSVGKTIADKKKRDERQDWFTKRVDALKGETVVWSSYAAEPTRAEELSLDAMHWVVTLLRYAYMSIRHDNSRPGISITADQSLVNLIVLKDSGGNSTLSGVAPDLAWTGRLAVLPSTRAKMRKAGVFVLSSILEESDNGKTLKDQSFRFALLQALQWVVDSLDQSNNASRILSMTVALETLFSEEYFNVTSQVADGTAMVLTHDPEERRKISKTMRDLYKKRSDAAHGGTTSISDADVLEMQEKATSVIRVLCHHAGDYSLRSEFWGAISLAKRSGQIFK